MADSDDDQLGNTEDQPIVVPLSIEGTWVVLKGIFGGTTETRDFLDGMADKIRDLVPVGSYFRFKGNPAVFQLVNDNGNLIVTRPGGGLVRARVPGISLSNPNDQAGSNSALSPAQQRHIMKTFFTPCGWHAGVVEAMFDRVNKEFFNRDE